LYARDIVGTERHGEGSITALLSQAARQGLAVLMATAEVGLKYETSTSYQSHIDESIEILIA